MTAQLGVILLMLAMISAIYATIAALIGERRGSERLIESARNAAIVTWPLLTAAALTLIKLLVSGDFSTTFVWSVTDLAMPTYLKVTALWGGQAGSLLFWCWLMSAFTSTAMLRNWQREHHLMPYVIAASMGTLTFFIVLVTFWENPFARYFCAEFLPNGRCDPDAVVQAMFDYSPIFTPLGEWWHGVAQTLPGLLGVMAQGLTPLTAPLGSEVLIPRDGQGLNPLLRHPGMIIHPPMLYLGFVSFVIPYAFAMAALARGELSDSWIRATRRWTLIGWLFLSLGLILGGWWAYDVLGWGGYWEWDPVENAALMPWLAATPFLHSVMIQEKRGMLRRWNMVLIILTYLLVILGTFATRSGFVSSVHSFAQSAIGPMFAIFLSAALIISVWLLIRQWDVLRSDHQFDSLLSRETMFLINNMLFLVLLVIVGIGTYYPVATELLAQNRFFADLGVEKSSLGAEFYDSTTAPFWIALVILMGIAPLIAWHRHTIGKLMQISTMRVVIGLTLLALVLPVAMVVKDWLLYLAYAGILYTVSITLFEYHRGAMARVKAHGEPYHAALWTLIGRNRRRYGGYMIHLGVVVMALGVIGSSVFQRETQRTVSAGQLIELGDYAFEYQNIERFVATDGRSVMRAQAVVYRDGREVARIRPRIDVFSDGQPMSIPGKYTSLTGDDFYVLLVTWEPLSLSSATFKIYHNPLVNWVWGGGFVFIAGTLIAAWPDFAEERRAVSKKQPATSSQRKAESVPAAGD